MVTIGFADRDYVIDRRVVFALYEILHDLRSSLPWFCLLEQISSSSPSRRCIRTYPLSVVSVIDSPPPADHLVKR
jgi:hypothetical protein